MHFCSLGQKPIENLAAVKAVPASLAMGKILVEEPIMIALTHSSGNDRTKKRRGIGVG